MSTNGAGVAPPPAGGGPSPQEEEVEEEWVPHWTEDLSEIDDDVFVERALFYAQAVGGMCPDVDPLVKEFIRRLQAAYEELDAIERKRKAGRKAAAQARAGGGKKRQRK